MFIIKILILVDSRRPLEVCTLCSRPLDVQTTPNVHWDSYYIFLPWVPARHRIVSFSFKNQRMELMRKFVKLNKEYKVLMKPNLNEQYDFNIFTLFGNAVI